MSEGGYIFSGKGERNSKEQEGKNRQYGEFEQKNSYESEPDESPESLEPEKSADAGPVEHSGPESSQELQQRVEQLAQEKEELMNRLMRLQADFDNYRKRVRTEKEDLEKHANFNLIKRLLPVIDNLERACSATGDNAETIVEGVQMISRQLQEILEKEGVAPIECQGKPFDPNCHEAVLVEESNEHPPNTVLDELQKGYRMKDKVLRASMVKVSSE